MDYSYSLDPTAPKKLSEAWTEFPGGKAWQRQAKSPCRYCNPTVSAEDWFVKPGYVYVGGGDPLDACVPENMSATRLATNVACLPARADEVFLDLSGAQPQPFQKKEFPADSRAACDAGSEMLHNNLGGWGCEKIPGNNGYDATEKECSLVPSLVPECAGKKQNDACSTKLGALAPNSHTECPKARPASPPTSSRRAQSSETFSTLRVP